MKYVFPDTNVFLHFKSFLSFDWSAAVQDTDVTLVISTVLLSELDAAKWKKGNSSKVQDRAKAVTSRLSDVFAGGPTATAKPGLWLELLDEEPEVSIDLLDHRLSRESQDDRFLAAVLAYRKAHPDRAVVLLSDDTGIRLKAQTRGVKVVGAPPSERQDEPDEVQMENARLRRELLVAKSSLPRLKLTFSDDKTFATFPKRIVSPITDDLVERKVDRERDRLRYRERKGDLLADVLGARMGEVPRHEIARYEQSVEMYLAKYEEALRADSVRKVVDALTGTLSLKLSNVGTAVAEDIDVRLTVPAHVTLSGIRELPPAPTFPKAPEQPLPTMFGSLSSLLHHPPSPYTDFGIGVVNFDRLANLNREAPRVVVDDLEGGLSLRMGRLKHHDTELLPAVNYWFESSEVIAGFSIEVVILCGTSPDKLELQLNVSVDEA